MNSFIENVNYIAGLDNVYGSKVELYKNNLSLKNVEHDIELKFSYYNNDDKKIHSIIHSEPGVLVGGIDDTLLSFKTLVESSITGSEFTCTVSSGVQNFVINNIVMVNIAIDSNNNTYKAYDLEMKVITAGAATYDVFGEVKDSLKILPSLAMITSSEVDVMANVYEIKEDIATVSESIVDVETVSDSIANVNTVVTNITNVNIVGEDIDNVNTVSTHILNVDTVSQSINNVNTVSSNIVDVGIASANISNINTVANAKNLADIIRVADDLNSLDVNGIADITIVANDLVLGVDSNIITVSESIYNINIAGNDIDNINTVAANIANVDIVSTNIDDINITANNIASINTASSNIADVNTVSDGIINVNTVSGSIDNVTTVASNIIGLNSIVSNMPEILLADDNAAIATTKALESSDSAYASLQSEIDAAARASSALNSANTATQQADIATVKSTEASASASSALISKNESATNSSNSLVNANNASISEANALAYKNSALSSKNSSAVSETNALSYSNLAHASELSSQSSATSADSSAINASNSEVASASSATLSSAKATESFNSANDALTSKNKAEKWAIELEDVPVEPGKYSAMHWALKAEELASGSAGSASSVSYDNSTSVLVANDVQSAIDEIDINIETLSSNVYTKTDINNSLALKVDKIDGKGLSTEDYTTIEKTKLSGIASGAQVNVPTDLSLGTVTATVISLNSSTGTDVNLPSATTSTAGLLSATDKTKLDGVATNANNYILPTATSTVKGGVGLYSDTVQTVDSNAVSTTANRTYGIQLNSAGQVVVNVPWSDTNTIYEHPITDGSLHVPATGTTNNGKVLMAGATAGSVSWQTIPSGVTDHTLLTNIGTNTHAQIDTALTRLVNTSGTNTGDQTITLTGDVIGSGTGSFSTTLKNTGTAGTYKSVTTDSQGRVISGTNPTTIAGFGITDVYTKTEVDIMYGDIASALDTINGEVI